MLFSRGDRIIYPLPLRHQPKHTSFNASAAESAAELQKLPSK
ncbi:MAG TPA: hypothetical protein V6D28_26540 [Leptolyngbyaceae cyanobacterium]